MSSDTWRRWSRRKRIAKTASDRLGIRPRRIRQEEHCEPSYCQRSPSPCPQASASGGYASQSNCPVPPRRIQPATEGNRRGPISKDKPATSCRPRSQSASRRATPGTKVVSATASRNLGSRFEHRPLRRVFAKSISFEISGAHQNDSLGFVEPFIRTHNRGGLLCGHYSAASARLQPIPRVSSCRHNYCQPPIARIGFAAAFADHRPLPIVRRMASARWRTSAAV